jgi:hypothetical protein
VTADGSESAYPRDLWLYSSRRRIAWKTRCMGKSMLGWMSVLWRRRVGSRVGPLAGALLVLTTS